MYYYHVLGYNVASPLPVNAMYPIDKPDQIDLEIIYDTQPDSILREIKEINQTPYFYWYPDHFWLDNSYCTISVFDDGRLYAQSKSSKDSSINFVLSYGIAAFVTLKGGLVIHCGAVSYKDKGIIITGSSGAGKSTLTSELLYKGAGMLSDDIVALNYDQNACPVMYPAFPQQKICRDVALRQGYRLEDLVLIDSERDKYAINHSKDFSCQPMEVSYIFEINLTDTKDDQLEIKELSLAKADLFFLNHLFLGELQYELGLNPYTHKIAIDCLKQCHFYQINRPKGKDTLQEILDFIDSVTTGGQETSVKSVYKYSPEVYIPIMKACIEGQAIDPEFLKNLAPVELYSFAALNKMLPVLEPAVKLYRNPTHYESFHIKAFTNQAVILKILELKRKDLISNLVTACKEAGLEPVFFKGLSLAKLYSSFSLRTSGDTDMYIAPDSFDKMESLLFDLGYTRDYSLDEPDVFTYYLNEGPQRIHKIELHTNIWEDYSGKEHSYLDSLGYTDLENCIKEDCCGIELTTMKPTHHLIYQMLHIIKHFGCQGIAARYLIDIALFIKAYGPEIDWKELWKQMQELHYDKFCKYFLYIVKENFDCQEIVLSDIEIDPRLAKDLLCDLLQFGTKSYGEDFAHYFYLYEIFLEKHTGLKPAYDGSTVSPELVPLKWQNNELLRHRVNMLCQLELLV